MSREPALNPHPCPAPMGITHACFGLSYLVALVLELVRQARPARAARVIGLVCSGSPGWSPTPSFWSSTSPTRPRAYGLVVLLAWVLAVFYLYGSVHHHSPAWGLFVLPVVLVLVVAVVRVCYRDRDGDRHRGSRPSTSGERSTASLVLAGVRGDHRRRSWPASCTWSRPGGCG